MSNPWSGTNALVTGASSGLGAAIARELAARGAHLVLTARTRPALEALARELEAEHGVTAEVITADLSRPDGATALCAQIEGRGARIDHVINNAGFGSVGRFAERDAEAEASMVRVNCEAPMRIARHLLPSMIEARRGGVLFVSSFAALNPIPYMTMYSASKAFVLHAALALAEELRGTGVRVMALCPNAVPTGFQDRANYRLGPIDRALALPARTVARIAVDHYERRARVCLPGAATRAMATALRVVPRATATSALGRLMSERID